MGRRSKSLSIGTRGLACCVVLGSCQSPADDATETAKHRGRAVSTADRRSNDASSRPLASAPEQASAPPNTNTLPAPSFASDHEGRWSSGLLTRHFDEDLVDFTLGRSLCVLRKTGEVHCGALDRSLDAVALPEPAVALSSGPRVGCALLTSGAVGCWGCAAREPVMGDLQPTPILPPHPLNLPKMKSIALGDNVACGITTADTVMCWGELDYQRSYTPDWTCDTSRRETVTLARSTRALALSPRMRAPNVWMLAADGVVRKRNELPQQELSDVPRVVRRWQPRLEALAFSTPANPAVQLSVGGNFEESWFPRGHGCTLRVDGRLRCAWGAPNDNSVDPDGRYHRAFPHACAVLRNGKVACVGDNRAGQAPPLLSLSSPARYVITGSYHSCALLADGTVSCWGAIGAETNPRRPGASECCPSCSSEPRAVPEVNHVTLLRAAADGSATCALDTAGKLMCWRPSWPNDGCFGIPRPG